MRILERGLVEMLSLVNRNAESFVRTLGIPSCMGFNTATGQRFYGVKWPPPPPHNRTAVTSRWTPLHPLSLRRLQSVKTVQSKPTA